MRQITEIYRDCVVFMLAMVRFLQTVASYIYEQVLLRKKNVGWSFPSIIGF